MERTQSLKRLHKLEEEIELLKAELEPPNKRSKLGRRFRRFRKFIISYWFLFSFLVALLTVVYAKVKFDIDYFEDYRNISTTKGLSEFYRQLGDRLMANSEWTAAEDAYRTALEINPNNIEATYGIVKAQVFKPIKGEKFFATEVAEAKLDYLLSHFPDDYQVYFLKGVLHLYQKDSKNAKLWFQKAINKNPKFVGGYISLGLIKQRNFDIEGAVRDFKKALELGPNYATANNNLGFLYLILANFTEAVELLERAYRLSPNLLTAINLGDAYRYSGQYDSALQWHQLALDVLREPGIENERYIGSLWLYNYMPQWPGDLETINYSVYIGSLKQKKVFVRYALSFDYALNKNFKKADEEFKKGLELDQSQQYGNFFVNKISSIVNLLDMDEEVREWLLEHRIILDLG